MEQFPVTVVGAGHGGKAMAAEIAALSSSAAALS